MLLKPLQTLAVRAFAVCVLGAGLVACSNGEPELTGATFEGLSLNGKSTESYTFDSTTIANSFTITGQCDKRISDIVISLDNNTWQSLPSAFVGSEADCSDGNFKIVLPNVATSLSFSVGTSATKAIYLKGKSQLGLSTAKTISMIYNVSLSALDVQVNQAAAQVDPTNSSALSFTIVFGSVVDIGTFIHTDPLISTTGSSSCSPTTPASLTTSDEKTFQLSLSCTGSGTVSVTIPAAVATISGQPNTASSSADNLVALDFTLPSATFDSMVNPQNANGGTKLVISGTCADSGGSGIGSGAVKICVKEGAPCTAALTADYFISTNCSSGTYYYEYLVPPQGVYDVEVYVQDQAGNLAAGPVGRGAANLTVDLTPPTSTCTGMPSYINATNIPVGNPYGNSVSCADTGGANCASTQCSLDGGTTWTASCVNYPWLGLTEGAHTLLVRSLDTAGNTQTAGYASCAFTVDTAAPGAFTVTGIDGLSDVLTDGYLTAVTSSPRISWTASTGAVTYRAAIRNSGNTFDVCTFVDTASTNATFSSCSLTGDQGYKLQVIAQDAAGNSHTQVMDIFTDWMGPTVTANASPSTASYTGTVTVSGNCDDGAGTGVAASGVKICAKVGTCTAPDYTELTNCSAGTYSKVLTLADGVYEIKTVAVDIAGNIGTPVTAASGYVVNKVTQLVISASPASVPAGSTSTLSVTAKNASNSLVSGFSGTVNLSSTGTNVAISGGGTVAISAGVGTANISSTTSQVLTVSLSGGSCGGGISCVSTTNVIVTTPTADPLQSTIAVGAGSVLSGNSVNVTLTARDAVGTQLSSGGLTVVFSHTGGSSTGNFSAVTDNGNGTYSATFTGVAAGSSTSITATINSVPLTSSLPTVMVQPGAVSLAQSTVTLSSPFVNSGSSITATLTTRDVNGNALTSGGLSVTFAHTGGTSTGTFGGVTDNSNGTYTASFTGVLAGTATSIKAAIGGSDITSALPTVTVNPGPYSLVMSQVSVGQSSLLVGAQTQVTLQIKDVNNNSHTSGGQTVGFFRTGGSSNGTFGSVTDNNDGTYTAMFTATAPGSATSIGATIAGSNVTSALPTIVVSIDLLDNDNSSMGFGGGAFDSWIQWNSTAVELNASGLANRFGTFVSRIMDAGNTSTWSNLTWLPDAPFGKPLPNNGLAESGYPTGNANMSGNVVLLHFDESSWTPGSASVFNHSSFGPNATVLGSSNSEVPAFEVYGKAGNFSPTNSGLMIPAFPSAANATQLSWETWIKPTVMINSGGYTENHFSIYDQGNSKAYFDTFSGKLAFEVQDSSAPTVSISLSGGAANASVTALQEYEGRIYAGFEDVSGNNDWAYCSSYDGSGNCISWMKTKVLPAGLFVYALTVFQDRLYIGAGSAAGAPDAARVFYCNQTLCDDAGDFVELKQFVTAEDHTKVSSFAVFNGTLHVGMASTYDAEIYKCVTLDGVCDNAGEWSLAFLKDIWGPINSIPSMAVFNGKLYIGTGDATNRGDVWVCDDVGTLAGCDTTEWGANPIYNGITSETAVTSLTVFNNRLIAGIQTSGTSAYVKTCPINALGDCTNAAWASGITITGLNSIESMIAFNGKLMVGGGWDATFGRLYICDPDGAGIEPIVCDNATERSAPVSGLATHNMLSAMTVFNGKVYIGAGLGAGGAIYTYGAANSARLLSTANSFHPNDWTHVAGTFDNGMMKIYVNGVLDASMSGPSSLTTNMRPLFVARSSQCISEGLCDIGNFKGRMDEFAYYTGRVLTGAEVMDRYRRGALKVNFQVMSCNDSACSGETWMGPSGDSSTTYSEAQNLSTSLPTLNLISIPNNRYFRYQMKLETTNSSYTPQIREVEVFQ